MKKYGGMIVLGLLALFIGLVISIQITTAQGTEQGGLVPWVKAQYYETELKNVRVEKDAALAELAELEGRLSKIEKEKADEDFLLKGIVSDLEKYKLASGTIDVIGSGVVVTVEDPLPPDGFADNYMDSVIMYNYEFLLSLINRMKDAGAEAISINGQRIIATTEISLAGDNVNINATPTAPPYVIKAIGNPDTIEATLTIRFGVVEQMKNYGLRVDIKKKSDVEVPRYSGIIKFRYAKPVEE